MKEANDDDVQGFDSLPTDRIFLEVKLFVDSSPAGEMLYRGDRLKAMNLPPLVSSQCALIRQLVESSTQKCIHQAGIAAELTGVMVAISEEKDDDKDSNSNEGTGEQQSTAATS